MEIKVVIKGSPTKEVLEKAIVEFIKKGTKQCQCQMKIVRQNYFQEDYNTKRGKGNEKERID